MKSSLKFLVLIGVLSLMFLSTYESNAIEPKKIKAHGNPKIAKWEAIDAALTKLAAQSNADETSKILLKEIFLLDDRTLFPLTNTVLKYVPEASLKNALVYNKRGETLGKFFSKYTYERAGGLQVGKKYHLVHFQYLDKNDQPQASGSGLLLDSFCVKWGAIKDRPGLAMEDPPTALVE